MMALEGKIDILRACELGGVSRAGFYREYAAHAPREAEMVLRDAIQRIVVENRFYGYRRVGAALREQGLTMNHKCVLRIMRKDNLLCLRKRRFVVTTDSHHRHAAFPNLIEGMQLQRINQLWVADITYIRLSEEFVYLAVILDAYSRKVVGWAMEDHLEASLALAALDQAVADRVITPGIVHHSDRGVQYASGAYVDKLQHLGFQLSMSRPASPWENAKAESFIKTLKSEEISLRQYRNLSDASQSVARFLTEIYNGKRLHSALGYLSPAEFERRHPPNLGMDGGPSI